MTRDAAAKALGVELAPDPELAAFLGPFVARHSEPGAAAQVLTQALVLTGAQVLAPANGTAAGQVVATPAGVLVLLPGPPREMRPMLTAWLAGFPAARAESVELGVTGLPESDVQLAAQRALARACRESDSRCSPRPGDLRVLLLDEGAGEVALASRRTRGLCRDR